MASGTHPCRRGARLQTEPALGTLVTIALFPQVGQVRPGPRCAGELGGAHRPERAVMAYGSKSESSYILQQSGQPSTWLDNAGS